MFFFFFNDTATTEIYTLSLHDALPICMVVIRCFSTVSWSTGPLRAASRRAETLLKTFWYANAVAVFTQSITMSGRWRRIDRKSTRLNSSHANISYAVFCLKKKKQLPKE